MSRLQAVRQRAVLLVLSTVSHSPEAEEVLQEVGAGAVQGQDVAGPLCALSVLLSKYEYPHAGQLAGVPSIPGEGCSPLPFPSPPEQSD